MVDADSLFFQLPPGPVLDKAKMAFDEYEKENKCKDNELAEIIRKIAANHRQIIEDWCKAYLAQMYEEGYDLKPGCFTLNEQDYRYEDGRLGKKYWFTIEDHPKFQK